MNPWRRLYLARWSEIRSAALSHRDGWLGLGMCLGCSCYTGGRGDVVAVSTNGTPVQNVLDFAGSDIHCILLDRILLE